MYIAILGRQPYLGAAELERLYDNVRWFSDQSVVIKTTSIDFSRLGGSQKVGKIITEISGGDWLSTSRKIVQAYSQAWRDGDAKITLGISAYGFDVSPREVQKTGIILKKKLRESGVSLRLVPSDQTALSTATSHHNKLGLSDNKVELLVVRNKSGKVVVAESLGAQNITAYAKRDQGRPKRDAFVGMLPPKLAQIMINLASPTAKSNGRLLDPFCGTGVLLQEAALMGYDIYGSDLAPKMIDFSEQNLAWLAKISKNDFKHILEQGDAMNHHWQNPVNAVACETYLGQPFSAPPSPAKLREVRGNCNFIIGNFLKNIASQIRHGTPLCIGVPAWRDKNGNFTHLPLVAEVEKYGFKRVEFKTAEPKNLLYFRENQVVARELLVLEKT